MLLGSPKLSLKWLLAFSISYIQTSCNGIHYFRAMLPELLALENKPYLFCFYRRFPSIKHCIFQLVEWSRQCIQQDGCLILIIQFVNVFQVISHLVGIGQFKLVFNMIGLIALSMNEEHSKICRNEVENICRSRSCIGFVQEWEKEILFHNSQ